jgi:hypothetical protein
MVPRRGDVIDGLEGAACKFTVVSVEHKISTGDHQIAIAIMPYRGAGV